MKREWARTAEDILWRRSKLGLHLSPHGGPQGGPQGGAARLDDWIGQRN